MQPVIKVSWKPLEIKLLSHGPIGIMTEDEFKGSVTVLDSLDAKDKHYRVKINTFRVSLLA